jgi:hypothetical protein
MGNDYQSQTGICNTTYAGEDRVYKYTAAGPETVCITMSNTTGNPTLAIYQGCPGSVGVCATPTPMVGNDSMQFTFPAAGTYYIIIDEPTGYSCYDLNITPPCIVGIDEQKILGGVLVFPNPVTDELKIESSFFPIQSIEICNLLEEKIFYSISKQESKIYLDLRPLPPGIYFIKLLDKKNNSVSRKIVKM